MTDILGLYPAAFYGILVGVLLVLYILFTFWRNRRAQKRHAAQARGMLLCEFCSTEGAFTELCKVWKGMIRKIETSDRGTFTSNRWINAPKGFEQFTDIYLVLPDHCYPVRWPEGKPDSQQITVMKTHFLIGDPIPKIAYNPSEWDKERYERTTTAIMKYAFDEKTMQVITSAIGDIEGRIQKLINYLKVVPLLFILGIIILLVCFVSLKMSCDAKSASEQMLQFIHR